MLPIVPVSASTLANDFEWIFWYITIVTGVVGLAVFAALGVFCVQYSRGARPQSTPRILGSHQLELAWTIIPLIIFLTFYAWGAVVYDKHVHPPEDAMEIFVIGKQWMWKAQYPGGQRVIIGGNPINMADDDKRKGISGLVLPVNRKIKVTFISEDVIHDFGVPAFRSKIDVIPGRYVSTWYEPTREGEYHVFCDQYCGTWHSLMVGKIRVVSQAEFDTFLRGESPDQSPGTGGPLDGSMAWEGQQLFRKLQCIDCHTNTTHARAPNLEGLYGSEVPLKGGKKIIADEAYIIESILKPREKVVEGWEPIMPHYQGQVTEEDLNKVVSYIKSLKPGKTIPPNERFPAPDGAPRQPPETSGGKN